jgi:hypothetical protein
MTKGKNHQDKAYNNLIDEYSAKSLGIKEFALKPFTKGTISNMVRKVLDKAEVHKEN